MIRQDPVDPSEVTETIEPVSHRADHRFRSHRDDRRDRSIFVPDLALIDDSAPASAIVLMKAMVGMFGIDDIRKP